jgi:hypothetical protein
MQMPIRKVSQGLLASLAAALALAGCGSGAQSTTSTMSSEAAKVVKAAAARHAAEARAPKGASPTLRAIYAQFPPPKPDPEVKRSAAAIGAGERACKGKSPRAVKDELYAAAKRHLNPEQAKMIARMGSYEKHVAKDANFVAGQLAADTYEATLPAATAQYGYQGCIYSLARRLEHKLAPKKAK